MDQNESPGASVVLLRRWRDGDEQAAAELWNRHAERLIALARRRLSRQLARRTDAEDVVQSAYRSFFAGARSDRFVLQQSGDLWRLLVAITLHKLEHQYRRHGSQKRSMAREQSLGEAGPQSPLYAQLLAREPSPDEAAALADELAQLMVRLKPLQQQMVEMVLQGYLVAEIAAATGRHEGTVRRNLNQVRRYLRRRCARWTDGAG
jgi:RNA polymerase sigma-70 factor (ECF subfamily)